MYPTFFVAFNKKFLKKKMASIVPKFYGLDLNDKWVESCGAPGCTKKHNMLKNEVMLNASHRLMNWWDFLDVLVCYQQSAECGLCTKYNWCRFYFKNLLGEAYGLTLNSWSTMNGQFFTAIRFSPHDECYSRRPMTVTPWCRRRVSAEEKEKIEEKEKKTILKLIDIYKKNLFFNL